MTQALTEQESLTILFSGEPTLPGNSATVFCKVEPLGIYPVLRIEWDGLGKEWKVEQVINKEGGANGIEGASQQDSALHYGRSDLGHCAAPE